MKALPPGSSFGRTRMAFPSMGKTINPMLLGVLAGLLLSQSALPAHQTLAVGVTFLVLVFSMAIAQLVRYCKTQSTRKAINRTVMDLERRLERLIPRRHMKAHGMHSFRPHSREESESNWMPVARQSRTLRRPQ